jgi:hypothetical protein
MIKSQDDLNPCNDGHRSSDVLLQTIEKCEKLEVENKEYRSALMAIEVETASLGGDIEDMETSLLNIAGICRSVLEKDIEK